MIKIFIPIFLLISHFSLASVRVDINFPVSTVKQGHIESVVLSMNSESAQQLQLQSIKGQALGDTIYLYDISPVVRKDGESQYEAEAKIIFLKVPEGQELNYKSGDKEIQFKWNAVTVEATEAPEKLIFGQFTIPSRPKILLWISLLIISLGLIVTIWFVRKKYLLEKVRKEHLLKLKRDLLSAHSYEEVVLVWKNKSEFLNSFPHIEEEFKTLETVLYRYQFKPFQSAAEKEEVYATYLSFREKVSGGFNGI